MSGTQNADNLLCLFPNSCSVTTMIHCLSIPLTPDELGQVNRSYSTEGFENKAAEYACGDTKIEVLACVSEEM